MIKEFIVTLFIFILMLIIVFGLGRRYESFQIKTQIEDNGCAISKWGDHSWIFIQGTVESYNKLPNFTQGDIS